MDDNEEFVKTCSAFLFRPAHLHDSLSNGDGEIRTLDPLLARQVLSQLSYTPMGKYFLDTSGITRI